MKKLFFSVILTFTTCVSLAQQIQVTGSRYRGAGCPDGSTEITFTPDNTVFSLLFSRMNVDSNQFRNPGHAMNMGLLECQVDIDINIPMGMQLELTEVSFKAFMDLPDEKTYGTLNSYQYFVGGTVDHQFGRVPGSMLIGGLSFIKKGPLSDNVEFKTSYLARGRNGLVTGKHISSCEGKADFKMKIQSKAHTFNVNTMGSVMLDTADGQFGSQYQLALKPCDEMNLRRIRLCKRGTCPR